MKKQITFSLILCLFIMGKVFCQTVFLDKYLTDPLTYTVIGTSANSLNQPRDLDFKPNTNELWVCNKGASSGGAMVIFYKAGQAGQTSQYRKDTHSDHFMAYPSAIAFSDIGEWASTGELQNNTGSATSTFMGPSLWLGDTSIFAKVCQNPWTTGYPLGSHIDMLHQSPYAMGIAFDSAKTYWVMDGWNGNIVKYNYVNDHSPGYDNHSAGILNRYTDVTVSRVPGVPSHMALDKATGWLYFIDGVSKTIKRMNTHTGTVSGTLSTPGTASETLGGYYSVTGATVEVIDTLSTQPCGLDFYNNRLIVSDYDAGNIFIYNTTGTPTLMGSFNTGHINNMGIKVGPDGKIWFVNYTENKVYRIDPSMPTTDVSIESINSPMVDNCNAKFYSTRFDLCGGSITPTITIKNNGTLSDTAIVLHYYLDNGTHMPYNWIGSLASGATTTVTLPASSTVNGSHLLSVEIMSVNGMMDDIASNNKMDGSFRVINPIQSIPYTQGFTSTTFPPTGWNYITYNKYCFMSRNAVGGWGTSSGSLQMNNYTGPMDITGQKDYFISPRLDFSTANTLAGLTFNVSYAQYNASSNDELKILASTDCGNTWATVYDKAGTTLSTAPIATAAFTPTSTQWRNEVVNLSAYAGISELMLMFTSISNYGNNFYIDDINIGNVNTGINEIQNNLDVSVYPNPISAEELTVQINNVSLIKVDYVLTNLLGQTLFSKSEKSQNGMIKVDVSSIAKGTYILKVVSENKSYVTKIVKQ
jgi:hypothetical protein